MHVKRPAYHCSRTNFTFPRRLGGLPDTLEQWPSRCLPRSMCPLGTPPPPSPILIRSLLIDVVPATTVAFLRELTFHGVLILKEDHVLLGPREVYRVHRILRVGASHYLWLAPVVSSFSLDEFDQMSIESLIPTGSFRLISLTSGTDLTAVWTIPTDREGTWRLVSKW